MAITIEDPRAARQRAITSDNATAKKSIDGLIRNHDYDVVVNVIIYRANASSKLSAESEAIIIYAMDKLAEAGKLSALQVTGAPHAIGQHPRLRDHASILLTRR